MAKQTFSVGQTLTAAQMTSLQQTAMLGGAASAKTASYTLVAADAGTAISMSNASATTITVNTGLFAAGDTVQITNLGAGVCTITAGTATVNSSASLALAQYESGTLDFTSTSAAIFIKGAGAAAASGGMTLISEQTASALSSLSFSSIPSTYKQLMLVWSGIQLSGAVGFDIRFNADSNSNYQSGVFYAKNNTLDTSTASGTSLAGTTRDLLGFNSTSADLWKSGQGCLIVDNYSSTTKLKKCWATYSYFNVINDLRVYGQLNSIYNSTSAISSIDITQFAGTDTFSNITNTSIRLYGLS